jgi:hypothetical protein
MTELIEIDGLNADLDVVEDIVEVIELGEQGPAGPPGPASEGLTPDQQAAIEGANTPSAVNPFVTVIDLPSTADFAPALGLDDNYVTDAEKAVLANTSGANTGDQTAENVTFTPVGNLAATNVQAAIEELDTENLNKVSGIATDLKETRQDTITTAVTSLDWSAGHIDINYAGNTDISTGGVTNIPTDGIAFLTVTL